MEYLHRSPFNDQEEEEEIQEKEELLGLVLN
jgi:hypothetical protein